MEHDQMPAPPPGASADPPGPLRRFLAALSLSPRAFALPFQPADWLATLLIVAALQMAAGLVLQDLFVEKQIDAAREQMQDSPNMSAEAREEAVARLSGEGMRTVFTVTTLGALTLAPVVGALVAALLLLLIVNFILGGQARFRELWMVTTISLAPKALWAILFLVLGRARSSVEVTFSPAAFLSESGGKLDTFLRAFDLFDLWVLAAQLVGIVVVSRLPAARARVAVLALWIVYWLVLLLATQAPGCSPQVRAG